MDGDGEDDERAEDAVEGGHGEGVVAGGDAFAEDDVGGESEGAVSVMTSPRSGANDG